MSQDTRKNIFIEYGPSWITQSDRFQLRIDSRNFLSREQRIIMRYYWHPNLNIKPPEDDIPLFKLRKNEKIININFNGSHVPINLRKYPTWLERNNLI